MLSLKVKTMLSDDELILQIKKNNLEALELLFFKYEINFNFLIKKLGNYFKPLNYDKEDLKIIMKTNMLNIIKLYDINKASFSAFWILMEKRHLIKIYREKNVDIKSSIINTSLDEQKSDFILNKYLVETPLEKYIMKDDYNFFINKIEENVGEYYKNILLLWSKGYSYNEIAKIYNITPIQVNNYIQKCFNIIKKMENKLKF